MITKAIVPVAGWGTRRLPITKVVEKSMLPVGNRPLVDYSVQELIAAGVTDIYMIISNTEPCQVKAFYHENKALTTYLTERGKMDRLELANTLPPNVKIHYIQQDASDKYGTAVPVAMAVEEYGINEPVLVFMGDDFIWNPGGKSATEELLAAVEGTNDAAIVGMKVPKEEVEKYGVFEVKDGYLAQVIEKPKVEEAPSNLINVSKYILTPEILQATVEYVKNTKFDNVNDEYMITEPITQFIANGGKMRVVEPGGEYLDGGTVEGWLHANNVVCNG